MNNPSKSLMFDTLSKQFFLLGDQRKHLPFILGLFVLISLLDILGLGMIVSLANYMLAGNGEPLSDSNISFKEIGFSEIQISLQIVIFFVISVFTGRFLLVLWSNYKISCFAQRQRVILATQLFEIYLTQDYLSYLSRREGDLINRLNNMISHYVSLTQGLLKFTSDVIVAGGIVAFLMFFNPLALFIFSAFLTAIYVAYSFTFRDQILKLGKQANICVADSLQISQDALRGYKEITVFGKTSYFVKRFRERLQSLADHSVLIDLHRIVPRNLIELSAVILIMMSLFFLDKNSGSQLIMASTFTVVVFAVLRLMPLFTSLTQTMVHLRSLSNSISQLHRDITSLNSNLGGEKTKQVPSQNFSSLKIENLSFSYGEEFAPLVKEVFFDIQRGDIVGLFGPSGVGKTTLVNIIVGLIRPDDGNIYVNGKKRDYNKKIVDLNLAYLPQDTLTLNANVAANVTLSDTINLNQARSVREALEIARLDIPLNDIIEDQDKTLGEQGGKFSGGQKQRIAIARAIYHKKDFFVFDEATNALDANLENQIVSDLVKSGRMAAGIIISHRVNSLRHCNRIIEIDVGKFREIENTTQFFSKFEKKI